MRWQGSLIKNHDDEIFMIRFSRVLDDSQPAIRIWIQAIGSVAPRLVDAENC